MTTITEELLTRADLMKLFQVSQPTIIRLEASGKLQAIRLGAGSVRYRKSDIERFIANPGQRV
jgi:excisionase family DNA binding protein